MTQPAPPPARDHRPVIALVLAAAALVVAVAAAGLAWAALERSARPAATAGP